MSAAACVRCGEPLVDGSRPCEGCRLDRIEAAVNKLRAAARSTCTAALAARADAVDTLRCLGIPREQVLQVRDLARAGHSTGEILEGLRDLEEVT